MDTNLLISNGVDLNHALSLLGDIATYNSIMSEFLSSYKERMERIKIYKDNGDLANYAIEVHSLKSDSKYLGFTALADISYKHEMASKAGDIRTVEKTYDELVNQAQKAIELMRKYLNAGVENKTVESPVQPAQVQVEDSNEVLLDEGVKAILIADDSKIIRGFLKDSFSGKYMILMAANGREVINIINSNKGKISALLLDLNMPILSGFDVLDYFKENDLFSSIPVSIISGSNDKESIDRAFSYPIVDMLNKPFSKEEVISVVEKTIDYAVMM